MIRYDLEVAFFRRLRELAPDDWVTARPDRVFNPDRDAIGRRWRRGTIMLDEPQTIAIGDGITSRVSGTYQVDLYQPRKAEDAFKILCGASDALVAHFFPSNGRGLSLIENATEAYVRRRPSQRYLGIEGAYLREVVRIDFDIDILPEV
jgi:hypothetical protein